MEKFNHLYSIVVGDRGRLRQSARLRRVCLRPVALFCACAAVQLSKLKSYNNISYCNNNYFSLADVCYNMLRTSAFTTILTKDRKIC